ncbi:MAG: hypothetical protein WC637_09655 [Victivallales bacterium]
MKIEQKRTIQIEASQQEVSQRANAWAAKCDFVLENQSANQMVFQRGSHWYAVYTFDVRKLPTVVSITFSEQAPLNVDCVFNIGSPFSISTPGDPKRVSEQFDLLIAYLRGALQ